jgi:tripeptide aminopeptidase
LHPTNVTGNVSDAKVQFIVRDFSEEGLHGLEATLHAAAAWAMRKYPGAKVQVEIKESYRNMKYVLDQHPHVTDYADEAIRRAGLTPKRTSIRGGTDGARLSFMGVPTPNLFDGSMNFHGKKEYVPLEWMQLAVETLLHLMDVWVERSQN